MSEAELINRIDKPATRLSLAEDLRGLGVAPGMALMVHTSLKALGWINGGPVALIQALQDVLTPSGTLVMPAHSGAISDPATWQHPPVPADWLPVLYETMPLYDPQRTPTRGLGRTPELFRTWPDVLRSQHPHLSFAAWGDSAEWVIANHEIPFGLGEGSPLARLYDLDGVILLLGVGYDSNTTLHLAEYRAPHAPPQPMRYPMLENGQRVWQRFDDIELDEEQFPAIGEALEAETSAVTVGRVATAESRLMGVRAAVDFATEWLTAKRTRELAE